MERSDIKRVLKDLGVAEALIEMPAVIEPIYKEMMERPERDLRKDGKVVVDDNGNFICDGRKIKLKEDGCAEITFKDAKITTNPVGIEMAYEDGGQIDFFSNNTRKDGIVINMSGNNGNASYYETTNLDNGSWAVRNASGVLLKTVASHAERKTEVVTESLETILAEFDSMSKVIIENYPKTAKWYSEKREEVKAVAEKELDPEEQNRKKTAELEAKIENLERRNKELTKRLYAANSRLEKAIEFIGVVKKSPFGKMFFGKTIKTFDEDAKKLPEGRE